jgi:hypothetical protein
MNGWGGNKKPSFPNSNLKIWEIGNYYCNTTVITATLPKGGNNNRL